MSFLVFDIICFAWSIIVKLGLLIRSLSIVETFEAS